MNGKWMKDLRKLGDDYTKTPPEGLLDDIKREMAARGLHVVQPRRRAGIVPLWRRIAIAAGIAVIVGVATLNYMSQSDTTAPGGSRMHSEAATPRNGMAATEPAAAGGGNGWAVRAWQNIRNSAQHGTGGSLSAAIGTGSATDGPYRNGQTGADEENRQPETDRPATDTPFSGNGQQVAKTDRQRAQTDPQTTTPYATDRHPAYHNTSRQNRWSFAALYSGAMGQNTTNASGPTDMAMMSDANPIPALLKLSDEEARLLPRADVPPVKHEKHHRPVKVGLSVQYQLNDQWSLQTGITYSRLTSDFTKEAMSYTETTKQKLHYIGIPVSVSYSVWRNKNINVYVKAGGEVEKLVKGSAATNHTDERGERSRHSADVHEGRPVFSTHAAAGVEYRPGQVVGIYVEPGLDYHIKNGSGISSSYTDKPLNVNLNVGARITF